jgi:hypothetical protein
VDLPEPFGPRPPVTSPRRAEANVVDGKAAGRASRFRNCSSPNGESGSL